MGDGGVDPSQDRHKRRIGGLRHDADDRGTERARKRSVAERADARFEPRHARPASLDRRPDRLTVRLQLRGVPDDLVAQRAGRPEAMVEPRLDGDVDRQGAGPVTERRTDAGAEQRAFDAVGDHGCHRPVFRRCGGRSRRRHEPTLLQAHERHRPERCFEVLHHVRHRGLPPV
jgi:hypothetical protein